MPKVTVVIPTYNCAKYLPDAINSVLNQTYKDFEIIVVDDGSTDGTKKVMESYMQKYQDRFRYFYQQNNGVAAARNRSIEEAKGEYIALLDADDEFVPNALEECIVAAKHNKSDWYIADIFRLEDDKKEIRVSNIPNKDYLINILKTYFIKTAFFYTRKSLLDIGLYDKNFMVFEDWDLNIRMLEANKNFSYINKPLYIYKIRKRSLVKNNEKNVLFFTNRILEKHHKRIALQGDKEIAKIYAEQMWKLARRYLYELKDITRSIYCIKESIKYNFNLKRIMHPIFFNFKRFYRT